jgi:outer membrane biogenesis lipoprotein LolB
MLVQIARGGRYVEGRDGGGSFLLLAACAADEGQRKAQQEEYAKAAAEAEAQIAQQDHARRLNYGKPGSAAYIDCRSSLKNDRADMKK